MSSQWLLFVPGFFAGMLSWPRILRWGYLVFFALRGKDDKLSDVLAPGGRSSLPAAIINSGLVLLAALVFATVLFLQGRLSAGWAWALAGFYTSSIVIGLTLLSVLRARKSKVSAAEIRDRRVRWIIQHKASVFFSMAFFFAAAETIGLARPYSLRLILIAFCISFIGGLLMATLLWFTIIRPVIDDYEYKQRRTNKPR